MKPTIAADDAGGDEAAAVMAHALINVLSVVAAAAATVRDNDHVLSRSRRDDLLTMIERQVASGADLLRGVVRGLPPELVMELDALDNRGRPSNDAIARLRDGDRRRRTDDVQRLRTALTEVAWEAVRRRELERPIE